MRSRITAATIRPFVETLRYAHRRDKCVSRELDCCSEGSRQASLRDAIPVHLLTQEAFRVYFEHLKADGVLAVHVSNQYLDLVPVCARAAELLDRSAVVVEYRDAPLVVRSNAAKRSNRRMHPVFDLQQL